MDNPALIVMGRDLHLALYTRRVMLMRILKNLTIYSIGLGNATSGFGLDESTLRTYLYAATEYIILEAT